MEKPREIFTADEEATVVVAGEEQTLVAPRFDDEETLVARPVVPLDAAEADAPEAAKAPAAHARRRPRRLPSRPTLLALIFGSVLIGGVLGGAGLYLYQRQSGEAQAPSTHDAPAAATSETAPGGTPSEAAQPTPAPAGEAAAPTPEAQPADAAANAPAAEETDARGDEGSPAPDSERTGAAPARAPETVPAVGAPKRGKKGERDELIQRTARRANGADSGAAPAPSDSAQREARRVDTILYRQRRAAARERARRQTAGDVDRLRRIFEGTPE